MKPIYLLLLGVLFASCHKATEQPQVVVDSLIVGHSGNLVSSYYRSNYFLLGNGQLWENNADLNNPMTENIDISKFNFSILMPNDLYLHCADILSNIPAGLFSMNHAHFGTVVPDAGYTEVILTRNGVHYQWAFEEDQRNSDAAIQQFVTRVRAIGY